jgi:hypothetical protein
MPRIPKRESLPLEESARMSLQEMSAALEATADDLWRLRRLLLDMQAVLYTRGFTERGPITENRDDIPF